LGTVRIRGRGSGLETEASEQVVAEFRDGRMVRFKDYGDHSEALRAVGLADGL
jgi:ketosteroid isomerase-like protein